ncbi:Probable uridine nucleosidase 2 (Uridine ribohydrolase 2) [Durusdinium trenchii]|uniref:Probable uridine nucleosidase 2 (Uridine ribohydrolase 2) n=1 Tax=Durusdinium trenchii TaxID=1381693 RepID=A0ABP0RFJ5_9DINO
MGLTPPVSEEFNFADTQTGVDDAFALCMALKLAEKSHFVLKLITCCFGNCSVEQVGMNVAKCLHACEVPPSLIRVVLGASGPLKQQEASNATHFHGNDGLGDATPPLDAAFLTAIGAVGFGAAVTALRELLAVAKKEGAEVTLVTLGPLTNLASALKEDAELPLLLHDLVVMGCCGNGRGNHGRVTEFNIHADPEAAAEVFARREGALARDDDLALACALRCVDTAQAFLALLARRLPGVVAGKAVLAAAHGEQLGLDGLRHRAVASLRPAAPLGDPGRNSGRAGGGKQKLPLPSWWNISGGRMVGWNQEDWV